MELAGSSPRHAEKRWPAKCYGKLAQRLIEATGALPVVVGARGEEPLAAEIRARCPDAIDLESFYNKEIHPADRMRTHNAYENVIVRDVFDLARRECSSPRVAVCGDSPDYPAVARPAVPTSLSSSSMCISR